MTHGSTEASGRLDRSLVPTPLQRFFEENPQVAVAFSGGVDSVLLLACACACGADAKAYEVVSQFQFPFEPDDARAAADAFGCSLEVLEVDILADPAVAANPPDRCYYCKKAIFGAILDRARAEGYPLLIDGTNASDDPANRPGFKAIAELGVRSPLREAGLSKDDVRALSRRMGLPTAEKPSYACRAVHLPEGVPITLDALVAVEADDWLPDRETRREQASAGA